MGSTRPDHVPALIDRALVVFVVAVHVLAPRPGPPRPPDPAWLAVLGIVLAVAMGAPLWWRRRQPMVVLTLVTAAFALFVLLLRDVPPFAVWAAVYSVTRYAPTSRALMAAAAAMVVESGALLAAGLGLDGVLPYLLVTVIAGLAGLLVSARRAQLDTRRREAVAEERLRIARDLHDLVGHAVSGIVIQSSTARLALEAGREGDAVTSLERIERSSREVLQQMRQLVGVLRNFQGATGPAPDLSGVAELVQRSNDSGVLADLAISGDVSRVPPHLGLTAYRIVQEALTNVAKHAGPSRVDVRLAITATDLLVDVVDNGVAAASETLAEPGHGTVGMRERVAAYGGELTVGPREDAAGWQVSARLPLAEAGRA